MCPSGRRNCFFNFCLQSAAHYSQNIGDSPRGNILAGSKCVDAGGGKAPILYVGIRELVKSLYIVPVFGWAACAAGIAMMFVRKDGRMLHDLAGNTRVVYRFEVQRKGEEKDGSR